MRDRESHERQDGVWHTGIRGLASQDSSTPSPREEPSRDSSGPYLDEDYLEELEGPRSWMLPATLTAIFCFLPTGLAAVYSAHKARKAYDAGDLRLWTTYTARARFLVFVTCAAGLIVYGAIIGLVQAVRNVHYT